MLIYTTLTNRINTKSNITDVYDKTYIDTTVYLKTDLYNKIEINSLFDGQYNKSYIDNAFLNYYTQSQITTFLAGSKQQ